MCVITTEKYVEQMDGQSNFVSIVQCYTEFLQYMIENSEMESESIHDLEKTIEMVVQGGNESVCDELQQFLFGRFLLNQLKTIKDSVESELDYSMRTKINNVLRIGISNNLCIY